MATLFERYREIIPDFGSFLTSISSPHPTHLRVNRLRTTPEELVPRMARYGARLRPLPFCAEGLLMEGMDKPGATLEYFLGHYHLQGLASMLPPLVLGPRPGECVLDLCASPGSKTSQIAAMMEGKGLLLANDGSRKRINILNYHLERLGVTHAVVLSYRGQAFPARTSRTRVPRPPVSLAGEEDTRAPRVPVAFDRILVDAPCTGEGTYRAAPSPDRSTRNRRHLRQGMDQSEDMRSILHAGKIQKALLLRAYELLKPGGTLVYSTCTYAPEENEEPVDFLCRNTDAEILPVWSGAPFEPGLTAWNGQTYAAALGHTVRIYPHRLDTWGFFIARIRKRGGGGDGDGTVPGARGND